VKIAQWVLSNLNKKRFALHAMLLVNDHNFRTKTQFSMAYGNYILTCTFINCTLRMIKLNWYHHYWESAFVAAFKVIKLHYNLLNKYSLNWQ